MALASWLVLAAVLLAQVFKATLHILSRVIMKDGTFVFALITYHNTVSALSIAPLAYYFERYGEKKFGCAICFLPFASAATVISDSSFYYYGLRDVTATFATNLYNLIPIFTFLLSLITKTEKLDLRTKQGKIKTFGVLLSLVGALVASLYKGNELYIVYHHQHRDSQTVTTQNSHAHWARGTILIIASCLTRALWFIVQRKLLAVFPFKYTAIMLQGGISSTQSAVIGLCLDRHVAAWKLGWNLELLAIVCSGTLYSAATFCLQSWVISIRGPTYPSMFNPVGLIFVTVTEALLLGEAIRVGRDSHTATTQNSHDHWARGATLIIASCLSRALWFIVQRKLLAVFPFKYTAIMLQSGITSMQSAVIGLCLDRRVAAWKLGWNLELLAIVCSGTLYSAATFCLLSWAISIRGPTYPSMFNPVGLIFVTVTEALLLGEAIRVGSLVGMILILAGLCSFLWGAKKKEDGESELTTQLTQDT
ncbi:Auxin-induced protein 5NG4 [Morus notabilis]|uniref:Auxin-induced protein 5NG4 n=1 Tax=Morus notabilis TaxID=981085 RepID=W9QJD8_9ROSA|nr:Auxin-induced protein 5NG4 [Morus notabilis]